ncbi:hypothetical protein F2Q70_00028666, partial [Brassica cretica]
MRREVEMQEVDWPKPSEEMQSRWLLQHSPKPKKKTVRKQTCTWTLAFIGIGVVIAFSMTIGALTHRHHYQQQAREAYNMALHTGLKFFNSRRSALLCFVVSAGRLPDENNITWRGDSCIRDRKYHVSSHQNLFGCYYAGGDAIKSSFKMSVTTRPVGTTCPYQQLGELSHVEGIIKWGTDYFLKTFDSSAADTIHDMMSQVGSAGTERYCGRKQVGSAGTERYCGMRPEGIDYERK